eukprot:g4917.t1
MARKGEGPPVALKEVEKLIFTFYCRHGRSALGVGRARQGTGSKLSSLTQDAFVRVVSECPGWGEGGTWLSSRSIAYVFHGHSGAGSADTASMGLAGFCAALRAVAATAFPTLDPLQAATRFYREVLLGPPRRVRADAVEFDAAASDTRVPRAWLQGKPWSGFVSRTLEKQDQRAHEAQYRRKRQQPVAPTAAVANAYGGSTGAEGRAGKTKAKPSGGAQPQAHAVRAVAMAGHISGHGRGTRTAAGGAGARAGAGPSAALKLQQRVLARAGRGRAGSGSGRNRAASAPQPAKAKEATAAGGRSADGGSGDEEEAPIAANLSAVIVELDADYGRMRARLQHVRSASMRDIQRKKSERVLRKRTASGGVAKNLWGKAKAVKVVARFARLPREQAEDQAAAVLQACWRVAVADIKMNRRRRMQKHRTRVARELLETERSYQRSLGLVVEHFLHPLAQAAQARKSKARAALSAEQVKCVFGNVEDLLLLSEQLGDDLHARMQAWSAAQCVGDVMSRFAPFMRLYGEYCRGYDESRRLLVQLDEKSAAWRKFRDTTYQQQQADFRGLTLDSLLIMPVQRIPRYVLLLRELLKRTWLDHCDRQDIYRALQLMEGVANDTNDAIRKAPGPPGAPGAAGDEGDGRRGSTGLHAARQTGMRTYESSEMVGCHTRFGVFVNIMEPHRRLIHDQSMPQAAAFLARATADGGAEELGTGAEDRAELQPASHFFLFNDLLVVADVDDAPPPPPPPLRGIIGRVRAASQAVLPPPPPPRRDLESMPTASVLSLCSYSAHVRLDASVHVCVLATPELLPHCFRVMSKEHRVVVTVQAQSAAERDAWVQTLREVLERQPAARLGARGGLGAGAGGSPGKPLERRGRAGSRASAMGSVPLVEVLGVEKDDKTNRRVYVIRATQLTGPPHCAESRHQYRDIEQLDHRRKTETTVDIQGVNVSHYLQAILLLEDVRAQPLVADFMGIPASLLSAQFAASYKGLVGGKYLSRDK